MRRLQDWSTYFGAFGIAIFVAALLLAVITDTRRDLLLLMGAVGVVLVGFYIITRPPYPSRQTMTMRTASQGVNVLIVALAFIGIIAAINFVADKQFSQRLDLTANHEHTLSQQTVQVLQNLTEPVNVTGFYTAQTQDQRTEAEALLKDYALKSKNVVYQFVDPDSNPALAQKYQIAQSGTLVFEKGTRTEKVTTADEGTFTNAILKVTQTVQPAVYFTTGHGEYNPADSSTDGMSAVQNYLQQINYKVEPLSLTTISNTLPADTRAVIIAGPTKPFTTQDAQVIQDYLDKGGRVFVMTDPNTDPGLGDMLKEWGLTLDKNLILDPDANYRGNIAVPVFLTFPDHPLTKDLQSLGVYFAGVSSITKDDATGKDATALFTTSASSCAKTDFAKLQDPQATIACDATDAKGPFVVGYAVEGGIPTGGTADQAGRLLVLGNASFATNGSMNSQDALGNQQFFGNSINWLAGQEQLIAIPARPNLRPLATISGNDLNLVAWTSVGLIPLAALIIGGVLWWRSR